MFLFWELYKWKAHSVYLTNCNCCHFLYFSFFHFHIFCRFNSLSWSFSLSAHFLSPPPALCYLSVTLSRCHPLCHDQSVCLHVVCHSNFLSWCLPRYLDSSLSPGPLVLCPPLCHDHCLSSSLPRPFSVHFSVMTILCQNHSLSPGPPVCDGPCHRWAPCHGCRVQPWHKSGRGAATGHLGQCTDQCSGQFPEWDDSAGQASAGRPGTTTGRHKGRTQQQGVRAWPATGHRHCTFHATAAGTVWESDQRGLMCKHVWQAAELGFQRFIHNLCYLVIIIILFGWNSVKPL